MAVFEKTFVQDLTQNLKTHHCEAIVFSADNESNVVKCALYQGAEPAAVTGSVVVYAIRADGNTVTFAGTLGNNVASATLPQSCFVAPGPLAVMLQIVSGDVKTTVLKAIFTVEASSTGAIIDPGHVIPDLSDIIAMLDQMEQATEAAYEAAEACKTGVYGTTAENVDLDVTDESGNVLARFAGGHVQTKEFDSAEVGDLTDLTTTEKSTLVGAINEVDAHTDANTADINQLKGQQAVKISTSDANDVDLDIADVSGNVLARFADGQIQTKGFDSARALSGGLYCGAPDNNEVLFTKDEVSVGDELLIIATIAESGYGCYINILNTSNTSITIIGRPSNGAAMNIIQHYTIPENFGFAKAANAHGDMMIYAVVPADTFVAANLEKIWQDKAPIPDLVNGVTDYRFSAENKLANPLFTTLAKWNTDNPSDAITPETVLADNSNTAYRIPTIAITNGGTLLIAAEHRENEIGDYGETAIDVARKATGGSWSTAEVVPFSEYGQCWNPEFLIDRSNGRIYLFYGTSSRICNWYDVTTAEGDYRYKYSDDDGVTWSSAVSLKSLWDTDAYDFCIPSCTQGITLTNGTFIVPSFCKKGTLSSTHRSWPLLLIKPSGGDWYFSSCASVDGIKALDECCAVEGLTENSIWLYCRPNTSYGDGANRGYQKFVYDVANDVFIHQPASYFETNRSNCFDVIKTAISSQTLFLLSFTDSHTSARENLTVWGSLDGDTWIRIYRANDPSTNGYSVMADYNGTLALAYEDAQSGKQQISYQNISDLTTLIYNSVTKYIGRRITLQDRMQILYNAANGID